MPLDAKRAVANGQASYKSGNLVEASQHFKTVAKSCSCQAGKPNLECTCSDFLAACKGRTLDAALRTPCKCPRRAHKRCKDELHITALASLVMVAVKARDYKLGLVYGQNLIQLAPRDPRGYLRLGQALRCLDKHQTALAVYQQGIGLVARANPEHAGLESLKEQEKIISKLLSQVDPLEALPAELLVLVLSYLDTRHHCRCLRLSKGWKSFMVGRVASQLWTCQHFDQVSKKPPKILKPKMIQKYLATYPGGQLKSLRIDDCSSIPLVRSKLPSVLRLCPQLQALSLGGLVLLEIDELPRLDSMPQLRSLHFDERMTIPMSFIDYLVTASRMALEELTLLCLGNWARPSHERASRPTAASWPELPRLRRIKLAGHGKGTHVLDLVHLVRVTPNLQRIHLQYVMIKGFRELDSDALPEWPDLQHLHMGDGVFGDDPLDGGSFDKFRKCLVRGRKALSELVLHERPAFELLGRNLSFIQDEEHVEFGRGIPGTRMLAHDIPHLRRVVLGTFKPLTNEAARLLLEPSLKNDTLRHLALHPFPWSLTKDSLSTHQWLSPPEETTGITALTISCLNGEVGGDVDNPDDALLRLVGFFPNLHDLDIGKETVQVQTLGRILKGGVQNIYHQQGASMLELKEWAQAKGKNVIQGSYYVSS